jgi:protein TonB
MLASVVLHGLLAAFLLHFVRSRQVDPGPNPSGTVELLMVERRGEPAPSGQPANQTLPSLPNRPSPQASSSEPSQAELGPGDDRAPAAAMPASDPDGEKLQLPARTAAEQAKVAEPRPPNPTERQEAKAPEVPQPGAASLPQAPVFNLEGTDSESNAIVMGKQVIPASPDNRFRNRPPVYPFDAAARGEHGEVVVVIHVSEYGVSAGADVAVTSGVASLDRAALDAVRKWHFRPAMKDGRSVPFDMPMRFIFEFN